MATVTSSSSVAQIRAAYLDNLSYETDGSTSKALAFIEACRAILAFPNSSKDGSQLQFDHGQVAAQLAEAQRYVSANSGSGGYGSVKHPDFAGFRD